MFVHLPSYEKYFLVEPTLVRRLSSLQKWLGQFAKIIEKLGIDSPESLHALSAIKELANLEFDLSKLTEIELNQVLVAISQVNFPESEEEPDKQTKDRDDRVSLDTYEAQLIVQLVNAELAIDLDSALKVASEINHKLLEKYLSARISFLNKENPNQEEAAKSLVEELKDGSFFGKRKNGKDPFQEGVLAAMGVKPPRKIESVPAGQQGMPDSVKQALSDLN